MVSTSKVSYTKKRETDGGPFLEARYSGAALDHLSRVASRVDTVQDFLINLGIKPHLHLLEIGIFSLYHVIIRPTKIMNGADKNWAHFQKVKYILMYFENIFFSKHLINKTWFSSLVFYLQRNIGKVLLIFNTKKLL